MLLTRRTVMAAALGLACGVPAYADRPDEKAKVKVEFRLAESKAADGLTEATVQGTNEKVYLHKGAALTAEDVASAKAAGDDKSASIEVVFTKAGAKKMEKLSDDNQGKMLAVVVNDKVVSAPVIRAKIGEKAVITGKFTKDEAEKIAAAIAGK